MSVVIVWKLLFKACLNEMTHEEKWSVLGVQFVTYEYQNQIWNLN